MLSVNELDNCNYLFKIVIIGDTFVGKSNLLLRFTRNEFDEEKKATIGVEFGNRSVTIDDRVVKAQIWDTAGQERFRSIALSYYRGSKGVLVVYDITNRESFDHVEKWVKEAREYTQEEAIVMLIGNKCDLEAKRQVEDNEGVQLAQKLNAFFMETSARDSVNVSESFNYIVREILQNHIKMTNKSGAERGKEHRGGKEGMSSTSENLYYRNGTGEDDTINIQQHSDTPRKSSSKCC